MTYQGWLALHRAVIYLTAQWRDAEQAGFRAIARGDDGGAALVADSSRAYAALRFLEVHLGACIESVVQEDVFRMVRDYNTGGPAKASSPVEAARRDDRSAGCDRAGALCRVDGCGDVALAFGLCRAHHPAVAAENDRIAAIWRDLFGS